MDRMSSPEQLNDYLKVCSPGVWLVLGAVILLLAGVCVWGIFGRLDTTLTAVALADGGSFTVYVSEDDIFDIAGKTVTVDGVDYEIADGEVSDTPVVVSTENFSDYALHVSGLETGEWVYGITFDAALAEGVYEAQITIESISPVSFVVN
ncbi:MAG: hypothetical protein LUC98_04635 [Lachnospiraceae bacterium]|nr:hypothetical protein [Lachnospiraceae bacterium]